MNRRDFLTGALALPLAASPLAYDENGQIKRREQINGLHQKFCAALFNSDGVWIGPPTEATPRIRLWHSMSLLDNPATREKANAIIRRCFTDRAKLADFSHFEYCASAQILTKQRDLLDPSNRRALTGVIKECFARQRPIYFRGYNDNFPAMENLAATLGGEMLDDREARQRGLDGMHRLLQLLTRRGLLSEYTSSTYTPITLLCYADIAEHSADVEAKRLASAIESRIWLDLASHFHNPTNILAGPHSRAYNVDSVGHLYQLHMLMYHVFGERVWLNPVKFLFPPVPKQVIHHDGDVAFMQASNVWVASGTYHPQPNVEELAFEKAMPFEITATSEFGAAEMPVQVRTNGKFEKTSELFEYPCGELVSTSYLTQDYAVGSGTCQFHDGNQTDTFFVNFRRSEKPSSLKDISTIFARYATNGAGPGIPARDPRNEAGEASADLFFDSGRIRTVQKKNTVLAVYQSKAQFLDDYSVLRLVLVVPVFYRDMRRIGVGEHLKVSSTDPETVWIEDDYLYAAFRPLLLTNYGRQNAVTVSRNNGYASISFYNYEGPPRRFTRKELLNTLNGFVAEIGSKAEYGSFDHFRSTVEAGRVEDVVEAEQRITSYSRPGVRLDFCHSLYFGGIKYALVDGMPQDRTPFKTRI
jgi:hypothetical protein